MEMRKILRWLQAEYPHGLSGTDCVATLAVLSPRLSDDEVKEVAREMIRHSGGDTADIGVLISRCLDDLPTPEDIERVQRQLAAWQQGAD
jgi:hypothetical protein